MTRDEEGRVALEVRGLTVAYQAQPVLYDVDITIPRGRLAAVVGPNGAGKTTLLKAMLGLVKPLSGVVRFHVGEGRREGIGYVPQSSSVDWDFPITALDVVRMGCYAELGWIRRPGREHTRRAMKLLEGMGMQDYARRQIGQLSGGQQQRVFLARALMQGAEIYLLDEPFKGVDARTEKVIFQQLQALKEQGKTVIVVHHDLQTVAEYFDWVTLVNVRVVANGPTQDYLNEENIRRAYRNEGSLLRGVR